MTLISDENSLCCSQDTIASTQFSAARDASTSNNTNSNSICNNYFCSGDNNKVAVPLGQDAIIQEMLKTRPATTDEYEMERQRRMYNMLRHSSHYKRIQVQIANTAWSEGGLTPTGLLDPADLDEANSHDSTTTGASVPNLFHSTTSAVECDKFSMISSPNDTLPEGEFFIPAEDTQPERAVLSPIINRRTLSPSCSFLVSSKSSFSKQLSTFDLTNPSSSKREKKKAGKVHFDGGEVTVINKASLNKLHHTIPNHHSLSLRISQSLAAIKRKFLPNIA